MSKFVYHFKRYVGTDNLSGLDHYLHYIKVARARQEYLKTLTLEEWNPENSWESDELERFATLMMIKDKKPRESPMILTPEMERYRLRIEIYNSNGVPDPSIESGLYWRTHPHGRKWYPKEERTDGRAFYR